MRETQIGILPGGLLGAQIYITVDRPGLRHTIINSTVRAWRLGKAVRNPQTLRQRKDWRVLSGPPGRSEPDDSAWPRHDYVN